MPKGLRHNESLQRMFVDAVSGPRTNLKKANALLKDRRNHIDLEYVPPYGECRTPLIKAAMAGKAKAVEFLLAAGANPMKTDSQGCTAAEWASINGYPSIAITLRSAEYSCRILTLRQEIKNLRQVQKELAPKKRHWRC